MDESNTPQEHEAATEAAQNVVDDVTSWEYSGDPDRIADKLDEGLDEAGVDVPGDEKARVVEEIDDLKQESSGTPDVGTAEPNS